MAPLKFNNIKGQSLIELLVALSIAGIFIVGMTSAIEVSLRTGAQNEFMQSASLLAQEELDSVAVVAQSDWHKIGLVSPNDKLTPLLKYYVNTNTAPQPFAIVSGEETKQVGTVTYSRYFIPEQVYRNNNGDIGPFGSGYDLDPATEKITAYVSWNNATQKISSVRYINRVGNRIFRQTDWSGGPYFTQNLYQPYDMQVNNQFIGNETLFSKMLPLGSIDYSTEVGAIMVKNAGAGGGVSGEIHNVKRYAWNDAIGWIDFGLIGAANPCGASGAVIVSDATVVGCANSNVGTIVLDCAHSPTAGLDCASPTYANWKVSNINGNLSGFAWNDAIGWISFDYSQGGVTYRVRIKDGNFEGYAWNNAIGWISFNCNLMNPSGATSPLNPLPPTCATSNYFVRTNWNAPSNSSAELVSSVFDTGISSGAILNSIMWLGPTVDNTSVQLWLASAYDPSNFGHPWDYKGPYGVNSGSPAPLVVSEHYNKRYFRYKVNMIVVSGDASPKIQDVIINWTP